MAPLFIFQKARVPNGFCLPFRINEQEYRSVLKHLDHADEACHVSYLEVGYRHHSGDENQLQLAVVGIGCYGQCGD